MSRQIMAAIALAALGAVLGAGLLNLARPAAASPGPEPAGRFSVAAGAASYVLCETETGRTWVFMPKAGESWPGHAWLPITRLDSDAEVRKWQIQKEAMK